MLESGIRPTGFAGNLWLPTVSPGPEAIIDTALPSGRDRLVVMPTGGGNPCAIKSPRSFAGRIDRRRFAPDPLDGTAQLPRTSAAASSTSCREQQLEVISAPYRLIRSPYIAPGTSDAYQPRLFKHQPVAAGGIVLYRIWPGDTFPPQYALVSFQPAKLPLLPLYSGIADYHHAPDIKSSPCLGLTTVNPDSTAAF